ncbi:MAG: thiol reductase thioredoxin [Gammaproteobacteria bacterium]|nr:thiol reductase thioredoxin [Gammaproteobacteria bacterium]
MAAVEMNEATLKGAIEGDGIVLVDFWAPWCGPCRAVAPHLEALAARKAGQLLVAKVNTDVHGRTAQALQVRAIPTLAIWKDGSLLKRQPGALQGSQLDAFVAEAL